LYGAKNFRIKKSGDLRRPARLDFFSVFSVSSVVQILLQIGLLAMPAPGDFRQSRSNSTAAAVTKSFPDLYSDSV
jgi:hypothetical protein